MVKIFLSLIFLADVVYGIWMVYSCKGMGRDLYKIKDDLNEIEKEMREVKCFDFVESEEDAKNYQIPDNLPARKDVEKLLKKID